MNLTVNKEVLSPQNGVELNVDINFKLLFKSETERVAQYLEHYSFYKKNGYSSILRWPTGIDPEIGLDLQREKINDLVAQEIKVNQDLYNEFKVDQLSAFAILSSSGFDNIASKLYGFKVGGIFELRPTAYGTLSSPLDLYNNKPAFFRLKQFRQFTDTSNGKDRTAIETLVHEIYAHSLTAIFRFGTPLDDYANKGTHAKHKERLMDLLGRTLLVRSGLIMRDDVVMQIKAAGVGSEISQMVDNIYYSGGIQDENNLRHDGNIGELVGNLVQEINRK